MYSILLFLAHDQVSIKEKGMYILLKYLKLILLINVNTRIKLYIIL